MIERGRPTGLPIEAANGLPDGLWNDDFQIPESRPAQEMPTGLIDVGFLAAALRRSKRVWVSLAVAGLIVGAALFVNSKPSYQATAGIFLKNDPNMDANTAIQTAEEMAQEPIVAQTVLKQLGLPGKQSALYRNGRRPASPVHLAGCTHQRGCGSRGGRRG